VFDFSFCLLAFVYNQL